MPAEWRLDPFETMHRQMVPQPFDERLRAIEHIRRVSFDRLPQPSRCSLCRACTCLQAERCEQEQCTHSDICQGCIVWRSSSLPPMLDNRKIICSLRLGLILLRVSSVAVLGHTRASAETDTAMRDARCWLSEDRKRSAGLRFFLTLEPSDVGRHRASIILIAWHALTHCRRLNSR